MEELRGIIREEAGKEVKKIYPPEAAAGGIEKQLRKMEGNDAPQTAPHPVHSYDRYCADCGQLNPDYKKPNLYCRDCGTPMGTVTPDEIAQKKSDRTRACANCGGADGVLKDGE